MVVISAAVLTKSGKALVARQFVDINRARLEGLLAAFPKLLEAGDSGSGGKKEHTFVETPSVRYVYQPIEDLYMLIITNKSSNILEDLDALTLLAKIVGDYCSMPTEEDVISSAFDLVFAFDEVFALGHKEKLTMRQIHEHLEMDSHNERIAEIMQANREREAADQAQQVAARLQRERNMRRGPSSGYGGGGGGGAGAGAGPEVRAFAPQPRVTAQPEPSFSSSGGMKLGVSTKSTADDAFLMQLAREDKSVSVGAPSLFGAGAAEAGADAPAERKGMHLEVKEEISATLEREGDVSSIKIRGELNLTVSDPACQRIKLGLAPLSGDYNWRTHPAIDKSAFKKGVLQPKQPDTKPFPLNRTESILKWTSQANVEAPITISCWPSKGNEDTTIVTLEYSVPDGVTLRNLRVTVPVASQVNPVVQEAVGDYDFDARSRELVWSVPQVSEDNADGSIEFVIAHLPSLDSLFPIRVDFNLASPISGINVAAVASIEDGTPVDFSAETNVAASGYVVENT